MHPTKFQCIWQSGFRGKDLLEINQSETRMVCGGHVCYRSRIQWAVLTEDLPSMPPTKFRFIWPNGFREEFKKSANQKQELPVAAIQLTLVISNSMGPWKKFESTVVRLKRSYEDTGSVVCFNNERETTRAKFWRAKTSITCPYSRNDFKHIRCFCCCFSLSVKFFESCETTDNF